MILCSYHDSCLKIDISTCKDQREIYKSSIMVFMIKNISLMSTKDCQLTHTQYIFMSNCIVGLLCYIYLKTSVFLLTSEFVYIHVVTSKTKTFFVVVYFLFFNDMFQWNNSKYEMFGCSICSMQIVTFATIKNRIQ